MSSVGTGYVPHGWQLIGQQRDVAAILVLLD